jgi:antitoxin component YwqK of YwqJK toxin-antitoxin module
LYFSKLTKKRGDTVEGTFQNGQPHGECIVHYADGSKFKGIFKNGKRKGAAIEENKDGKRFEGSYSDDLGDGKFIEKDRNGKVIVEGVYVRGHRQVK